MKKTAVISAIALCMGAGSALADKTSDAKALKQATQLMQQDFQTRGIAKVDRLEQDDPMALCTKYRSHVPANIAQKIEAAQMQTIKFPEDGKYMGDWKSGDKIAQSGRGETWSDK